MNEARRLLSPLRTSHIVLSRIFNGLGCGVLMLLMVLTVADVTGRYFFNRPLVGMFELTEFMLVSLVFMGMGHTPTKSGHLSVTIFTERRSPRTRFLLRLFNALLSSGLLLLVAAKSFSYSLRIKEAGEVSATLQIPVYPFIMLVSFGALSMAIGLILTITQSLDPKKNV